MHLIIGTGKVGLPLSQLFHASNIPALSTSRSGNVPSPLTGVAFDWNDPSTFDNPFSHAQAAVRRYTKYFNDTSSVQAMKPFIDFAAKEKGVKGFVLLSSSLVPLGGIVHGVVHKYLLDIGV